MKTIELSTGTLLVVALPEDELTPMGVDLNGFDFLGHPSEITGEVWGKVWTDELGALMEAVHEGLEYNSPRQSGLSFCAAHNIQESDVLLFKHKNKEV